MTYFYSCQPAPSFPVFLHVTPKTLVETQLRGVLLCEIFPRATELDQRFGDLAPSLPCLELATLLTICLRVAGRGARL